MNPPRQSGPMIPEVDPLRFSLQGSHLIEASAGTGKTWTIAALYVRLVLGHGELPACMPAQILVLTFTDAAAQELRDRIRSRLSEAAAGFAAGLDADADQALDDAFLRDLRASYEPERWAACARLLDLAAQSMDEAAISTIHAWCMRVLREHAFDSGVLFDQEILADLQQLSRETAWDYWRHCVAGLDQVLLADIVRFWAGPDALLQAYGRMLTQEGLPPQPALTLAQVCAQAQQDRRTCLDVLKADWQPRIEVLDDWLQQCGKQLNMRDRAKWVQSLRDWATRPELDWPVLTDTAWSGLLPDGLHARWRGDSSALVIPDVSQDLARLRDQLNDLPGIAQAAGEHALAWMAARLRQSLANRGAMGFDGLLSGLADALHGAQGESLAQTLRRQFPVVLIDEFQDTDPVQYRIFDRVYHVARSDSQTGLIFIGDPKQAIYSFRGADLHTYLRAAQACEGRVQTLNRNYRSSAMLVQAVNHVFDRRDGTPVFPTGQAGKSIDFHPVQAQGRDERWQVQGSFSPAMQACFIGDPDSESSMGVTAFRAQAAQACARHLLGLLRQGRQGRAGFQSEQGLSPVRAADMAVLVNNRGEAALIQDALSGLGVRSVYLSDRRSVYESPVAEDLGFILAACAHPENEQAIRAALATPLLGQSISWLAELVSNEWAWDEQVGRFQRYQQYWRRRGVLPMLRRLLQDFSVPARLLGQGAQGERQLTDCLHLAELLQQASGQLDGEEALLHYLAQQCDLLLADADAEGSLRLRLESDESRVRIVTVHKSKGLEYPLVFLPFVSCGVLDRLPKGPQAIYQDGERRWCLQLDPAQTAQWQAERLGEETRKLYVALTRARHAVWLALGRIDRPSGMTQVLGQDLYTAWDQRCERYPDEFAWEEPAVFDAQGALLAAPLEWDEETPGLGPARQLQRVLFPEKWWISSYSALQLASVQQTAPRLAAETAAEDVLQEEGMVRMGRFASQLIDESDDHSALVTCLADFPRGSEAGTFLHGLLEWAARRRFLRLDEARDMIARRCAVRGWETHIDALDAWLRSMAVTEWHPELAGSPVLRLDALQSSLAEMEFWLPVCKVSVTGLDRIIVAGSFDQAARPALQADQLNGLFKGFIDLTLEHDGRYYLIDYKSNDLGPKLRDYRPDALLDALCAARYDVQMLMYVLALHRQLRARLPDYDYARHMGGAIYMFLRGRDAPGQGLLSLCPPQDLIESLDTLFAGEAIVHD